MNWMLDKDDQLIIPPKSTQSEKLQITSSQANMTLYFVIGVLPLLILAAGLFVWLRRRHL